MMYKLCQLQMAITSLFVRIFSFWNEVRKKTNKTSFFSAHAKRLIWCRWDDISHAMFSKCISHSSNVVVIVVWKKFCWYRFRYLKYTKQPVQFEWLFMNSLFVLSIQNNTYIRISLEAIISVREFVLYTTIHVPLHYISVCNNTEKIYISLCIQYIFLMTVECIIRKGNIIPQSSYKTAKSKQTNKQTKSWATWKWQFSIEYHSFIFVWFL